MGYKRIPKLRLIRGKVLIYRTNIECSKDTKTAPIDKHNESELHVISIMKGTSRPELDNTTPLNRL
jgi:hypothetical protein